MNLFNLAFLAPVIMAWNSIKTTFQRCSSFLFVNGEVHGQLSHFLHVMLWQEWKVVPLGPRRHATLWLQRKSLGGDAAPTSIASMSGAVIFRKGYRLVSWEPREGNCGRLVCVRGLVNYDELIAEATKRQYDKAVGQMDNIRGKGHGFSIVHFQGVSIKRKDIFGFDNKAPTDIGRPKTEDSRPSSLHMESFGSCAALCEDIYPLIGTDRQDIGVSEHMPPLKRHYVDPQMEVLLRETEAWVTGMVWMRERGIPHRRGILLEGPPGTGKSSFVKALAENFHLRLVIVELATCSDFDLPNLRELARTPSIFLFEDIDRIFEGSRNMVEREDDKVTFDAFLNLLSGADAIQGLVILTSNHPDKLDEALLRPGRVDRRVVVPLLSKPGRESLAGRILRGCDPELIQQILDDAEDQPAAQFENTCIQAAMAWYWTNKLKSELPSNQQSC